MQHSRDITADLARRALTDPDREALVLPGRRIRYAELDDLTTRAASYFQALGVRSGHVVATLLQDDLSLAVATLGLLRLGATVARLSSSSTSAQLQAQMRRVRIDFLVGTDPPSGGSTATCIPFDESDLPPSGIRPAPVMDADTPVFLLFGSGSTDAPKVMPISAQNIVTRCRLGESEPLYPPGVRLLMLSGLQFAVPMIRLLVLIHTGGTLILRGHQRPELTRYCRDTQATLIQGAAMHFEQMLSTLGTSNHRLFPTVRAVRVGGSTVHRALRERIRRHIAPVVSVSYATNESGVIAELNDDGSIPNVPDSVGRPLEGVNLRIVSAGGDVLQPGEIGMIEVQTPCLISGYLDDPAATSARFRDGWFLTGDLGRVTPEGELIYCGRADAMMIYNGINIYPAEIENCLRQLEDVKDLHVFALRHPVHQDVPACALSLKNGSRLTEAGIMRFLKDHLGFKTPKLLLVIDDLPRTGSGKLDRVEFRQLVHREVKRRVGSGPRAMPDPP